MHRSGTSALSGIIHQLGFDFGSSITEPSWDNPAGFYENFKIQDLNDEILESLGRTWDMPGILDEDDLDNADLDDFSSMGKKLIMNEFSKSQSIAIKDPRICLLFPFWQSVLEGLGYDIRVIFLVRDPREIASSLEKRNFFSQEKSMAITSSYWLSGEITTRGVQRTLVSFDQLLTDANAVVRLLIDQLSLPKSLLSSSKVEQLTSSIKAGLRHNQESEKGNINENLSFTQQIYYALLNLSGNSDLNKAYERIDESKKEFLKYDAVELKRIAEAQQCFAKLIYDDGEGFSEAKTRHIIVSQKTDELTFVLDANKRIIRLVVFPVNAPCILSLTKIKVDFVGDEVSYEVSDNSYSIQSSKYIFKESFPQFIIEFKSAVKVRAIRLAVEYQHIGEVKEEAIAEQDHIAEIDGVLQTIIKYPLSFIKNINLNNYRTLRRAMKRESPRQILRNFIKLLKRSEHQKLITNTSAKNKEDIIGTIVKSPETKLTEPPCKPFVGSEKKLCQVLYISPTLPELDTSSGGKRATKMLELLSTHSQVTVLCIQEPDNKYQSILESKGVKVFHFSPKKLKEKLPIVDVIICAWYYTFFEIDEVQKLYPEARLIIDSVDVHWVREERSIGILKDLTADRVKKNKVKEIQAYNQVDVVWAVSKEDKKAIVTELSDAEVNIVSNIHSFERASYSRPDKTNLLFIGGYNHYPNLSAAIRLAKEIFPMVKEQCEDAQLIIAGSNAPQEILELDQLEGVTFIGWVTSEEIGNLYDKTLLCVAPLLTGAGVKGKITEAISFMTPVVTNAIGNEGIHLEHQSSGILAESDADFAKVIIEAILGKYNLDEMAHEAQQKIKAKIGPNNALNAMWLSFYRPVDICIVTYNRLDLLKACIESIFKNTLHPNYNIIVFSNGCIDGTKEYLQDIAADSTIITPIFSNTNEVFVRPNNKMMKLHSDRDVVLLNNDVEVAEGWLMGLSLIAYRSSLIGIVGSKILYPDNSLQEFGSELYIDGTGLNIGKGDNPDLKEYSKTKAVAYVSGCSMYIKRSTIQKIGTFDDAFHPCYCEDSDYCYTAWESGIQTVVSPYSLIYHHEGSTSGTDTSEGFKKYQAINMEKFWKKHEAQIKQTKKAISKANKVLSIE